MKERVLKTDLEGVKKKKRNRKMSVLQRGWAVCEVLSPMPVSNIHLDSSMSEQV